MNAPQHLKPDKLPAVIYARVSTLQKTKIGDGLGSQETRCREYARYKGYDVTEVFQDKGVSGGLIDRPGMKAMLAWLFQNRRRAPVVLINDISRLARDLEAHMKLRAAIGSVGAKLESPSIEFGEDSDSLLVENMLASVSQHQRQKNAEQTKNRMRARMLSGYYCFIAPTGYTYGKAARGGKMLVRDEPAASVLQEALEGFASGRFDSQADVGRFLAPKCVFKIGADGSLHPQRVKNLLTNRIYAGHYDHPDWSIPLTKGHHDGLISFETFQRIQTRLTEDTYAPPKTDLCDDFQLRGFVTCGACGHPMSAYWAKGRNKKYPYYECFQKDCDARRKSIPRGRIEGEFETLLHSLRPSKGLIALAEHLFRDLWDYHAERVRTITKATQRQLRGIEDKIVKTMDRLIATDSETLIASYEGRLKELEAEKAILAERQASAGRKPAGFERSFRTAMDFLANHCNLWKSSRLEDCHTVLKLVFAAPLPYVRNKGFRTAKTTIPFKVLDDLSDPKKEMADRGGFEPPTP